MEAVAYDIGVVAGSEAVRCYTCSSDHDPRCADPIDKTMLPADCSVDQVKRSARSLASVLGTSATLGVDAFGERYAQYGGGQTAMGCQKLDILGEYENDNVSQVNVSALR